MWTFNLGIFCFVNNYKPAVFTCQRTLNGESFTLTFPTPLKTTSNNIPHTNI